MIAVTCTSVGIIQVQQYFPVSQKLHLVLRHKLVKIIPFIIIALKHLCPLMTVWFHMVISQEKHMHFECALGLATIFSLFSECQSLNSSPALTLRQFPPNLFGIWKHFYGEVWIVMLSQVCFFSLSSGLSHFCPLILRQVSVHGEGQCHLQLSVRHMQVTLTDRLPWNMCERILSLK